MKALRIQPVRLLTALCILGLVISTPSFSGPTDVTESNNASKEATMQIHYLEIVTPDVDATCEALGKAHGVTFGEPVLALGNARTASLEHGGRIGVRAPMRETEQPVVRPYTLVADLDAAVTAAREAGGEIAIERMELPGQGIIAIYLLGGIDHGLWQEPM